MKFYCLKALELYIYIYINRILWDHSKILLLILITALHTFLYLRLEKFISQIRYNKHSHFSSVDLYIGLIDPRRQKLGTHLFSYKITKLMKYSLNFYLTSFAAVVEIKLSTRFSRVSLEFSYRAIPNLIAFYEAQ